MKKTLLYYEISEKIKNYILSENLQTGDFLPSERNLSTKFNIACITLRKSLECLCEEGLLEKIPRKGSKIVALPEVKKTQSSKKRVGITIWLEGGINHPGILNIIKTAGEEFPVDEYEIVMIYITNETIRKGNWEILNDFDGLILSVQEIPENILKKIERSKQPAVFVNHYNFTPGTWCDEQQSLSKMFNYLSSMGHERIAFVTGPAGLPMINRQIQAFKNCYKENGLELDERYLIKGSYDEGSGYQKTKELIKADIPPTAILLGDDFMAMGALKALDEHNLKCPDDISIVCFGEYIISEQLKPPVTILKGADITSRAAKILKRIIDGEEDVKETVILERELIVRESTGLAKKMITHV